METSTIFLSHGLWHCSPFLDTGFPAEKHQQNPTETTEVGGLQEGYRKLVLYLEPKATTTCMDQSHSKNSQVPKDWGNRSMLGSLVEISHQPLLVHKSLLLPCCISKSDFKSSEENYISLKMPDGLPAPILLFVI